MNIYYQFLNYHTLVTTRLEQFVDRPDKNMIYTSLIYWSARVGEQTLPFLIIPRVQLVCDRLVSCSQTKSLCYYHGI